MKKSIIPVFFLLLSFLISACGTKPAASPERAAILTPEPTAAPAIYETPSANYDNALTLGKFLSEYESAAVYEDIYLNGRYLLIYSGNQLSRS